MSQAEAGDEPTSAKRTALAFLAAKREQSCQAVYTTFGSRSVIKCIGSLSVRLEELVWSDPFADRKQTTLGKRKQVC